jgi:hypothetical protein
VSGAMLLGAARKYWLMSTVSSGTTFVLDKWKYTASDIPSSNIALCVFILTALLPSSQTQWPFSYCNLIECSCISAHCGYLETETIDYISEVGSNYGSVLVIHESTSVSLCLSQCWHKFTCWRMASRHISSAPTVNVCIQHK